MLDTLYLQTSFPVEDFKDDLLQEYNRLKDKSKLYLFKSKTVQWPSHSNYRIISDNIPIAQSVADKFKEMYDIVCYPRYYILNKGFMLDIHKDDGTLAAFNYLLSDINDPINYHINNDVLELVYNKGLVNLQELHSVPVVNEVRLLLKMSIYDQSFEECKTRIEKYENSNLR